MTENLPDTNVGNIEYISKQDALECVTYDEEYTTEQIKGLPSADVVPVVRCRDCKHLGITRTGMLWCMHDCGMATPELDGHCSYGERREE